MKKTLKRIVLIALQIAEVVFVLMLIYSGLYHFFRGDMTQGLQSLGIVFVLLHLLEVETRKQD